MLPRNDKIRVGSRVKFKRGTRWANHNQGVGTVMADCGILKFNDGRDTQGFKIRWDDGYPNLESGYYYNYPEEDLEHVAS